MSVWPNIDCQHAREAASSQTRVALPICSLKSWRNHGGFLKSLDFSSCWKVNKAEFYYEQLMQQQYRCTEQPKAMAGQWKLFYCFRRESQPTPKQLILPGNTFRDPPRGIYLSWSQIQSSQQPRLTLLHAKSQFPYAYVGLAGHFFLSLSTMAPSYSLPFLPTLTPPVP